MTLSNHYSATLGHFLNASLVKRLPRGTKASLLLAALSIPILACAVPSAPDAPAAVSHPGHHRFSHWTEQGSGERHITIVNDNLLLSIKGKVVFAADDQRIESMAPLSRLQMTLDENGDQQQELDIRADVDGQLNVQYWLNGKKVKLTDSGDAVIAEVLPQLLKETGINAKQRIKRILASDGFDGVMVYIDDVKSPSASSSYLAVLLELQRPSKAQWAAVAAHIEDFDEQHNKVRVLVPLLVLGESLKIDEQTLMAPVQQLDGEHYIHEVFSAYLAVTDKLSYQKLASLLSQFNSDHYRSDLLKQLIEDKSEAQLSVTVIDDLLRGFNSDHYRSEVYQLLLRRKDLQSDALQNMVMAFESDHYRVEIMSRWLNAKQATQVINSDYFTVLGFIGSEHFKATLFERILIDFGTNEVMVIKLLNELASFGSDHFASQIINRVFELDLTKIISDKKGLALKAALKDSISRLNSHGIQKTLNKRLTILEKI